MEFKDHMIIHISEKQTITELSQFILRYDAEIYLSKLVGGSPVEVNLKSFLGLILLQLKDGDKVLVRAVGSESPEAVKKIQEFFSKGDLDEG